MEHTSETGLARPAAESELLDLQMIVWKIQAKPTKINLTKQLKSNSFRII